MNFDLKEMYRYLISHTLPGLLLLIEISLFLYPAHRGIINKIFVTQPAVVILSGYGFSTLLGVAIDGIRHFIFDFFVDLCSRGCWCDRSLGISRWFYLRFDYLRTENKRIQKGNITAIKDHSKNNDECMKVYQHFIEFSEEAIWYPYEAYANIAVAMVLGFIFIFDKLSWRFELIYLIVLIALCIEAVLIYKGCSDDQETFLEIYSKKFKIEVVGDVDEALIKDIVNIDRESFPQGWTFPDAKEYFTEILKNEDCVRVILKDAQVTVGYLLAIPHNDARKDLEKEDSLIQEDVLRYYIESVAILPAYRRKGCLSEMMKTLVKELNNKGINKFSMHARVLNKFSDFIQKRMKVTQIRRIEKWKYYNYEEPTDYIEVTHNGGEI